MATARQRTLRFVGTVRLRFDLPAVELHEDRRFTSERPIAQVRRFFRTSLPKSDTALEGGSFVLSVMLTYEELQRRQVAILSRWKWGESVAGALDAAESELRRLNALKAAAVAKSG